MEPTRKAFRGLWRFYQALRPARELPAHAAPLDPLLPRLRMLASGMMGEIIDVAASGGLGGMFGNMLLLPAQIDACAERACNEQLYILRAIVHVRCAQLGFELPDEPRSQQAVLALLMAARQTHESLERELPGARTLRLELAPELLAHRPHPHYTDAGGVLEALTQYVLAQRPLPDISETGGVLGGHTQHLLEARMQEELAQQRRPSPSGAGGVLEGGKRDALAQRSHSSDAERDLEDGTRLTAAERWPSSLPSALRDWWSHVTTVRAQSSAELQALAGEAYAALRQLLPGTAGAVPAPVVLWGRLVGPAAGGGAETLPAQHAEPRPKPARVVTLRRAVQLQRREAPTREDKPLYHAFEKLETAEDYNGETGTPDPEQNVAAMQDALEDLSFATAVRTQERPQDLVRAEVVAEPAGLEIAEAEPPPLAQVFRYPEWDHRRKQLREDHCTLIQEQLSSQRNDQAAHRAEEIVRAHKRQIEDIRMHLLRSFYQRTVRNRQLDGPEIDVEAMVERHADLQAGQSPPERLFLSTRKSARELAVVMLLDTSFSTDAWIAGRRVLDVEIEALIVLAAALEGYVEEEVMVAAFHSQTRNSVRFDVLKDFSQSWRTARELAPLLAPQGYTRIGAAVRHATALLEATEARHKLLLLVSDGKPTDFDRYEGNYGVEDVAHAVRQASASGIQTFGLAIEQEAKLYLARMLGTGRYRILPNTTQLPDIMAEVFLAMVSR